MRVAYLGPEKTFTEKAAKEMSKLFLEVIIAPDFTRGAIEEFSKKKNLRVIKCELMAKSKQGKHGNSSVFHRMYASHEMKA